MNKERYNQIIDESYKNYYNQVIKLCYNDHGVGITRPHTQEEFIDRIKTEKKFSEMWGLKIEERELSHDERIILMNKKLGVTDTLPQYYNTDDEMDKNNVPTKVITVTYNNEIIEFHE